MKRLILILTVSSLGACVTLKPAAQAVAHEPRSGWDDDDEEGMRQVRQQALLEALGADEMSETN